MITGDHRFLISKHFVNIPEHPLEVCLELISTLYSRHRYRGMTCRITSFLIVEKKKVTWNIDFVIFCSFLCRSWASKHHKLFCNIFKKSNIFVIKSVVTNLISIYYRMRVMVQRIQNWTCQKIMIPETLWELSAVTIWRVRMQQIKVLDMMVNFFFVLHSYYTGRSISNATHYFFKGGWIYSGFKYTILFPNL